MTNPTLKEEIQKLTDPELLEIKANYETFEKNGSIGTCALRIFANDFCLKLGVSPGAYTIMWMEKVAFETYRELYNRSTTLNSTDAERLIAYDEELSKVMPDDYKDWWQNNKKDWPVLARFTIEELKADRDWFNGIIDKIINN